VDEVHRPVEAGLLRLSPLVVQRIGLRLPGKPLVALAHAVVRHQGVDLPIVNDSPTFPSCVKRIFPTLVKTGCFVGADQLANSGRVP
jgi:hypothetical protein